LDVAVTLDILLILTLVSASSLADLTNTTTTIQVNVLVVAEVLPLASLLFAAEDTPLMNSIKSVTDAQPEFSTTIPNKVLVSVALQAQIAALLMNLASLAFAVATMDTLLTKLTKSATHVTQPNTMTFLLEDVSIAQNLLLAAHLTMDSSVSVDADLDIPLILLVELAIGVVLQSSTMISTYCHVLIAQNSLLAAD